MVDLSEEKGAAMELRKYEDLPTDAQEVIELCKAEFGDLFDNNMFGPFIEEFTPYSNDRLATLLEIAVGRLLMLVKMPSVGLTVENYPYGLPTSKAALVLALTVEMIRHYIRTYVEIPDTSRVGAPDVVRRDYLTRWQSVLDDYKRQLDDAAKKMTADMYNSDAAAGLYYKTLIDYPSIAGTYIPWNSAERPMFGWW